MTLYRQVVIVLVIMTIVSLGAVLTMNIRTNSEYLRAEQQVSTENALTSLGMRLAPVLQPYDRVLVESTILAAFDGAFYKSIDVEVYQTGEKIHKGNTAQPEGVPVWFTDLFSTQESVIAEAPVTNGWNEVAMIRIEGHPGFLQAQLWDLSQRLFAFYSCLFVIAALAMASILRFVVKKPLENITRQVEAIENRDFSYRIPIPRTRELSQVVKALNHLTSILSEQFQANAAQLSTLRTRVQQDPETKVVNRRYLISELQARLSEQRAQAVVMLSFQERDKIRKHHGYKAWLDLLTHTIELLEEIFPQQDVVVGRLSETDFSVLIPMLPEQDFSGALQRLAEKMGNMHQQGLAPMPSVCAIAGVAVSEGDSVTDVFTRLDQSLRDAQQKGSNPWLWQQHSESEDMLRSGQEWVNLLREQLNFNALQLRFQPLVSELEGEPVHREVYASIQDEEGKQLNAAMFVPVIEQFDLGSELDRAVLNQVRAGSLKEVIAINVSLSSIRDTRFLKALADVPASERHLLVFELAEVYIRRDLESVLSFVSVLRSLGYKLGIDNVGVGEQDLGYIREIKPDYMKVAASLCREFDEQGLSIIEAIVNTVRNLGIPVYATAVETEQQYQAMISTGILGIQGYLVNDKG